MDNSLNDNLVENVSVSIIQYLQKKKQMSLRDIGKLMGLSKSYISRVSNGKKSLTLKRLRKLEEALDCPLPELLLRTLVEEEHVPDGLQSDYADLRKALKISASFGKTR